MMEKIKSLNRTVLELELGIVLFGLVVQSVGVWFVQDKAYYSIGLWLGIMLAMLAGGHMWKVLDRAFDGPEEQVGKQMAKGSMIRYAVLVVAFGAVAVSNIGNPLLTFVGIMGLKVAAYLQPFTHKFTNWIFHETDPIPEPLVEDQEEDMQKMEE